MAAPYSDSLTAADFTRIYDILSSTGSHTVFTCNDNKFWHAYFDGLITIFKEKRTKAEACSCSLSYYVVSVCTLQESDKVWGKSEIHEAIEFEVLRFVNGVEVTRPEQEATVACVAEATEQPIEQDIGAAGAAEAVATTSRPRFYIDLTPRHGGSEAVLRSEPCFLRLSYSWDSTEPVGHLKPMVFNTKLGCIGIPFESAMSSAMDDPDAQVKYCAEFFAEAFARAAVATQAAAAAATERSAAAAAVDPLTGVTFDTGTAPSIGNQPIYQVRRGDLSVEVARSVFTERNILRPWVQFGPWCYFLAAPKSYASQEFNHLINCRTAAYFVLLPFCPQNVAGMLSSHHQPYDRSEASAVVFAGESRAQSHYVCSIM
eukprot:c53804_g1_i1.p1 GENE.c53804_g1_i1~~c53804_g1_i1.p1  ORF type:complete len:373 (-),score=9.83 c53804_g1_i1:135-1253(-)